MLTTLKRILKWGWKLFWRDGGIAAATIFILVVTVFSISSLFILRDARDFIITSLQEKADISVFFEDSALEEDILDIREDLSNLAGVRDVKYVSKEEALESFVQKHKNDPDIIKGLAIFDNPFTAHLNVQTFESTQYISVVNFLESSSFSDIISEIDYSERKMVIDRIYSITAAVKNVGIVFSIILSILAVLIAFNTIRLAIYNAGEEIKVQRLVGASNSFIQGPFLVQGAFLGIFSAGISFLITAAAFYFLSPRLEFLYPGVDIYGYFSVNFWTLLLIQLGVGMGLGIVSGFIAIQRYLKA